MYTEKNQILLHLNEAVKVLYVEDSDIVRESTSDMMKEFFAHIDLAVDGVDGLEKYKDFYEEHGEYYDIVFTDINMPKMNGIDLSEAILVENEMQHIVVISAHNEADYLLKLINMGIAHFILKPIEIIQFQKVISKLTYAIMNEKILQLKQEELLKMTHLLAFATKEAEESSRHKSQFLANMSHEIRTPLNAITGFISLLNEKETDPQKLQYLNVIQNASNSLLQIINDILDISKIESGKMKLVPINFSPYKDLITTGELFQAKASEKGIVLKIKYNYTMPESLYGDMGKIKQIFSNLLSNAIKFTPTGATVKCIIWYDRKGYLNIRVKDYGIGISKEKQEYIFEPFTQEKGSTLREYEGTGLGLSICKKLTEMLDGTLTVESEEGKGSIFLLSTPFPKGIKEEEKEKKEPSGRSMFTDKHILIAEDNETNSMFLGIVLDNIGITYEVAKDGIKAVEKFQTGKYDLILMDENMPNLSGSGATQTIRKIEEEKGLIPTPIISLTANAFSGDRERFLKAGMDDYLSKPIEPKVLIELIKKYL